MDPNDNNTVFLGLAPILREFSSRHKLPLSRNIHDGSNDFVLNWQPFATVRGFITISPPTDHNGLFKIGAHYIRQWGSTHPFTTRVEIGQWLQPHTANDVNALLEEARDWLLAQNARQQATVNSGGEALIALKNGDWYQRFMAAKHLGALRDPNAVGLLIESLKDANEGVRMASAEALGKIGDPIAKEALAELLADPSSDVRKYVREAIEQLE